MLQPPPASGTTVTQAGSVRVMGVAKFKVDGPRTAERERVEGVLTDELDAPIPNAPIHIAVLGSADTPRLLPRLTDCAIGSSAPPRDRVITNAEGGFCAEVLDALQPEDRLEVRFAGSAEYQQSHAILPTSAPYLIRFPNPPRTVSIEQPVTIPLTITANRAALAELPSTVPLRLSASSGKERLELFSGDVPLSRVVPIPLSDTARRDVGPLLVLAQIGTEGSNTSSDLTLPLWRTARVRVIAAAPPRLDGRTLHVELEAKAEGLTPPEGALAVTVAGSTPSFAALSRGRAQVSLTLPDPAEPSGTLVEARFVALDGRWEPAEPLRLPLPPPRAPSPLPLLLLWAALGLALTGWMAWRNRAMGMLRLLPSPSPSFLRRLVSHIPPLRRRARAAGIDGSVCDRADESGVANARVLASISGFSGALTLGDATTDLEGRFHLPSPPHPANLVTLTVTHPRYRGLTVQIDATRSWVTLKLESLRRAALRDLEEWVEVRGSPYAAQPFPTPGTVAELARRRAESDVLKWANEVESVAFGPLEQRPVPVRPPT